MPSLETEPISRVNQGWLWAARCPALISFLITLGLAFAAASEQLPRDGTLVIEAGPAGGCSIWRCFVFYSIEEKIHWHSRLAWAPAMGFIALSGLGMFKLGKSPGLTPFTKLGLVFSAVGLFVVCGSPAVNFARMGHLGKADMWLFWSLSISSLMLRVNAVVAFSKMRHETHGTGRCDRPSAPEYFAHLSFTSHQL